MKYIRSNFQLLMLQILYALLLFSCSTTKESEKVFIRTANGSYIAHSRDGALKATDATPDSSFLFSISGKQKDSTVLISSDANSFWRQANGKITGDAAKENALPIIIYGRNNAAHNLKVPSGFLSVDAASKFITTRSQTNFNDSASAETFYFQQFAAPPPITAGNLTDNDSYYAFIEAPNTTLGAAMRKGDAAFYYYGKKDKEGILRKIDAILVLQLSTKMAMLVNYDAAGLIRRIEEPNGNVTTITNYDLELGTISCQLKDKNGTLLQSIEHKPIDIRILHAMQYNAIDMMALFKTGAGISPISNMALLGSTFFFGNPYKIPPHTRRENIDLANNIIGFTLGAVGFASALGPAAMVIAGAGLVVGAISLADAASNYGGAGNSHLTDGQKLGLDAAGLILGSSPESIADLAGIASGLYGAWGDMGSPSLNPFNPGGGSTGDPHLTTFDMHHFDFQSWGEFTAAKSKIDGFEVQVRQESPVNSLYVTLNTGIAVNTGSDTVCVLVQPLRIFVNGKAEQISKEFVPLRQGGLLTWSSESLKIITGSGNKVLLRRLQSRNYYLDYQIHLSTMLDGKVSGLLGNNDGNEANDSVLRNENAIGANDFYTTYANSWRITDATSLFVYPLTEGTAGHTKLNFPTAKPTITDEQMNAARLVCGRAGVTRQPYLNNCMYDVAVTGDTSLAVSALGEQDAKVVINNASNFFDTKITKATGTSDMAVYNLRLELSCNDSDPASLNAINWAEGKVYALKDLIQNSNKIDAVAGMQAGLWLFTPHTIKNNGSGSGTSGHLFNATNIIRWNTLRSSAVEMKDFSNTLEKEQDKTGFIATKTFTAISSVSELLNAYNLSPLKITDENSWADSYLIDGGRCDELDKGSINNFSAFRVLTQEGKRGLFLVTGFGKDVSNKYWLTMDVKIEK